MIYFSGLDYIFTKANRGCAATKANRRSQQEQRTNLFGLCLARRRKRTKFLTGFCEAYSIALPLKGFTEDLHSSSGKAAVSLSKPRRGLLALVKFIFHCFILFFILHSSFFILFFILHFSFFILNLSARMPGHDLREASISCKGSGSTSTRPAADEACSRWKPSG